MRGVVAGQGRSGGLGLGASGAAAARTQWAVLSQPERRGRSGGLRRPRPARGTATFPLLLAGSQTRY